MEQRLQVWSMKQFRLVAWSLAWAWTYPSFARAVQDTLAAPCSDPVVYQGVSYGLVPLGTQCWFAHNLEVETYRNGDPIPLARTRLEWSHATVGVCSPPPWQELPRSGRLYSFAAVCDARGLCPSGFHVPTLQEWRAAIDALGGPSAAGAALKSPPHPFGGWNGNGESDFRALPVGMRSFSGKFFYGGVYAAWWTSTPHAAEGGWFVDVIDGDSTCYVHGGNVLGSGFSVRCVADR